MSIPDRQKRLAGRHAMVDGIPFELPVDSKECRVMVAVYPVDLARAADLLPGDELHPFRFGRKGLLILTVIDYIQNEIGPYIEYGVGIACTRGGRPAPPFLPLLLRGTFGFGQFLLDVPVSTEVSVKGGKGIWGMPKHQASMDFYVGDERISSRYEKDGELVMQLDVDRPDRVWLPIKTSFVNYAAFRGMLMRSAMYFEGKMGLSLLDEDAAELELGEHPKAEPLRRLDLPDGPLMTAFLPSPQGVLDDHFEGWFLTHGEPPREEPPGMEDVIDLELDTAWPPPPDREDVPRGAGRNGPGDGRRTAGRGQT